MLDPMSQHPDLRDGQLNLVTRLQRLPPFFRPNTSNPRGSPGKYHGPPSNRRSLGKDGDERSDTEQELRGWCILSDLVVDLACQLEFADIGYELGVSRVAVVDVLLS